jgi:hypothetical protein
MEHAEKLVSTRITKELHSKIVKRQREAKKQTGIEPKISAVVRAMLEEAAGANGKKR